MLYQLKLELASFRCLRDLGTVSMACKSRKSPKKLPIISREGSILHPQRCYECREGKVLFLSLFLKEQDFCGVTVKDIRCWTPLQSRLSCLVLQHPDSKAGPEPVASSAFWIGLVSTAGSHRAEVWGQWGRQRLPVGRDSPCTLSQHQPGQGSSSATSPHLRACAWSVWVQTQLR